MSATRFRSDKLTYAAAFVLQSSDPKSIAHGWIFHSGPGNKECLSTVSRAKCVFQTLYRVESVSITMYETRIASLIYECRSVGDFGVMAGLSGEKKQEKATTERSEKFIRDQEYYAVYNV